MTAARGGYSSGGGGYGSHDSYGNNHGHGVSTVKAFHSSMFKCLYVLFFNFYNLLGSSFYFGFVIAW